MQDTFDGSGDEDVADAGECQEEFSEPLREHDDGEDDSDDTMSDVSDVAESGDELLPDAIRELQHFKRGHIKLSWNVAGQRDDEAPSHKRRRLVNAKSSPSPNEEAAESSYSARPILGLFYTHGLLDSTSCLSQCELGGGGVLCSRI